MGHTLVILAAGMGSRFGGPKQLEALGPNGEVIVDFSIYDACRSGFDSVVLIIRRAMWDSFERSVCARWRPHISVELCFQELDDLPASFAPPMGRSRPWGTAHALLSAESAIDGPFAVINADDFYGVAAFEMLSGFLREAGSSGAASSTADHVSPTMDDESLTTDHVSRFTDHGSRITDHAVVGFPLRGTLGDGEPVNRALLRISPAGWLDDVEEITGIEAVGQHGRYHTSVGTERTINGDALISMNMWGFRESVFTSLKAAFHDFIAKHGDEPQSEFLLPAFVASMIHEKRARVKVLRGGGEWCGVTHPGDRPRVARFLRTIVERGDYPVALW